MTVRQTLAATMRENAEQAAAWDAPFYAALLRHMAGDVLEAGPSWRLLEEFAEEPADHYYSFRALSGVHLRVLAGEEPELEDHYPSVGGDGDADAAWPAVRAAFGRSAPEVVKAVHHPLQTNETARCGALIGGFLCVASETGLPVRALGLGVSAGLNLHLDQYRYEARGQAFGPQASPVRFVDYWKRGTPPLSAGLEVAERRGCDIAPIDVSASGTRLRLRSYVFADHVARLRMLEGALEIAQQMPVAVDAESADSWVKRQLQHLPEGLATVVFHSVMWIYLPDEVRAGIREAVEAAGAGATRSSPVAWLSYEEAPDDPSYCDLRLRSWPGHRNERWLARGGYHLRPIDWLR